MTLCSRSRSLPVLLEEHTTSVLSMEMYKAGPRETLKSTYQTTLYYNPEDASRHLNSEISYSASSYPTAYSTS